MTTAIAERRPSLLEIEQSLQMLMQDREETQDLEELAAIDAAIQEYVAKEIGKVDRIRGYIRYAEGKVLAAKQAAAEATSYAQIWQNRIERIRTAALTAMQLTGQKRLEGTAGTLSIRANGGVAPLKIQDDILPDEYRNITVTMPLDVWNAAVVQLGGIPQAGPGKVEPANARIREALKEGAAVPGAYLGDRGESLVIR